jgi:hypothetical protein
MKVNFSQSQIEGAILLLALLGFDSAAAYAKGSANPDGGITDVVAHLSLTGNDVVGIFKRETQGRRYLLLQRSSPKTMLLVDITNPKKAVVKGEVPYSGGASGGSLQLAGSNLLLVTKDHAGRKPETTPSSIIVLSVPNKSIAKEFSGLTSFLADDTHGLAYFTNPDGLWILRIRDSQYDQDLQKLNEMTAP